MKMFKFAKRFVTKFGPRLEGKLSVITGAGRGIGLATCQKFLDHQSNVVAIDIDEEILDYGISQLEIPEECEIYGYILDVTEYDSVRTVFEEIDEKHGGIDVLINNAGITSDSMLLNMEEEQWDNVININLKGFFNCGKSAAKSMVGSGNGGSIINISSVVGIYGNFGQTNYSASKFGVNGLTKTWSKELGRFGIRVNSVAPGFIRTEMTETVPEETIELVTNRTPLGRVGEIEEIADVLCFLASDEASFVTGHVMSVDGGLVL